MLLRAAYLGENLRPQRNHSVTVIVMTSDFLTREHVRNELFNVSLERLDALTKRI